VPEVVEIFPTNFCNFNCPHCRFREHHRDATAFMDVTLAQGLLEELRRRSVENIELSGGGEPLVHPRIGDLFEILTRKGFRVGLITNGHRFVHSDALKEQATQCCTWIRFSVDAFTDASYRRVHGREDIRYVALKRTLITLRRSANRTPKLGLKVLISKLNSSDALLAIPEALDMGADYVQLKFLGTPGELALGGEDVARLSRQIEAQIDSIRNTSLSAEFLPPYRGAPGSDKCLMTFLHPVIDWDGELYLCAFFEHRKRQHSLGNIRTGGFFTLWESAHHKEAFEGINSEMCVPNCPMRRYNTLVGFMAKEAYRRGFI